MRSAVKAIGIVVAAFLLLPAVAVASAPVLKSVSQNDLRVSATFSAPQAGSATIYVAKGPQQNPDGSFLTSNIADVEVLTTGQIASGKWTETSQLAAGRYWVMVGANPAQTCLMGATVNPSCADGDSNVRSVTVSLPTPRYKAGTVSKHSGKGVVALRLTATPLGVPETLKLCYAVTVRKRTVKHCLNRHLAGITWTTGVVDQVQLSTRGMSKRELFTWSLSGRTVARLTVKIP